MPVSLHWPKSSVTRQINPRQGLIAPSTVIAGFFTGGSLAIRGGMRAARNGAIMCAIFLAVIEGVGIGFQRMMAEQTRLDVCGIHVGQREISMR